MHRLITTLTLVFGFVVSSALAANAQVKDSVSPSEDVDIAEIAGLVLDADPDALLEGLESPPDDRDLPEGFFNPPTGVPQHADLVEAFASLDEGLDGAIGSVGHPFDTDPTVIEGFVTAGIVSYIVSEEEFTRDDLDDFEAGASEGPDDLETGLTGSVERIEVAGQDAALITVEVENSGVFVVAQTIALPVGNTLVISAVVVSDLGEVDADVVFAHAESLTLAGTVHLGEIAEDAAGSSR